VENFRGPSKSDERAGVVQGTLPRELCHSEWIMGMVMGGAVGIRRKGGKPMGQTSTSRGSRKPDAISEER